MKVCAIIQARMTSTRLPGKVLAPLAGVPLLAALVDRTRTSRVESWWLATTDRREDDVTAAWGIALGLQVFRGSEHDVLARFAGALKQANADAMVRLTADNPFTDGAVIELLLDAFVGRPAGTAVVGPPEDFFPIGYAPEVADVATVLTLDGTLSSHEHVHRGHVLSKLYEAGQSHALVPPSTWPARPHWRWTVDTPEDVAMAARAFECFGDRWRRIGYVEMVSALDGVPDIPRQNAHVRQKGLEEG
jgi:spore coat polysaccharide biosynthesis protein SpsF